MHTAMLYIERMHVFVISCFFEILLFQVAVSSNIAYTTILFRKFNSSTQADRHVKKTAENSLFLSV